MTPSTQTRLRRYLTTALLIFGGLNPGAWAASLQPPDSFVENPLDQACYGELAKPAANQLICQNALDDAALEDSARSRTRQARLFAAMAMLQAQQGELQQARATMNRALALAATDPMVRGNQGNLLLREGAYQEAVAAYNELLLALQEQPANPSLQAPLYLNRSLALRALGYYDEASKDVELYLTLIGAVPAPTLEPAALPADREPAAQ